ncbi:MAG: GGDEF domain-containing protein [Deltaproteobacteria bacterium]|nr:GGDEF domain-containing protein [Deltaproteobacteria bacterium]
MRQSPGSARVAFEVLERALAAKDPADLAGDVAAFLAAEHGAALCGVHFREEGRERAAVATTLSESATALHLDRVFPDGRPELVTITTVASVPVSGLAISRWRRSAPQSVSRNPGPSQAVETARASSMLGGPTTLGSPRRGTTQSSCYSEEAHDADGVVSAVEPKVRDGRDSCSRSQDTATLGVFWMGRAVGLECLLETAGETVAAALDRALQIHRLERLATRDALTDLANSRAFWSALARECARSVRYGTRLSLALVDLDDFKSINDRHGHLEGDRVLEGVARAIRGCVRDTDLVARLGGDEIAVLMPESDSAAAVVAAARILDAVSTVRAAGEDVRASVGVAEHRLHASAPEALVDAADRELYRAKRDGGHRVSVPGDLKNVA